MQDNKQSSRPAETATDKIQAVRAAAEKATHLSEVAKKVNPNMSRFRKIALDIMSTTKETLISLCNKAIRKECSAEEKQELATMFDDARAKCEAEAPTEEDKQITLRYIDRLKEQALS